jgi:hypothetical protein
MEELSDEDFRNHFAKIAADLREAAENQNNTPWHEACFAAAAVFSREAKERGIILSQ